MFINPKDGSRWLIERRPSIFITRNGKEDITISKAGNWGGLRADNNRYHAVVRLAAEDGGIIRDHGRIPSEITLPMLRQLGFVDAEAGSHHD
jgi:hypothetical protein